MMFGYACRDTDNFMPLPLELSHMLLRELAAIRREKNSKMPYLRPDAKSQVTIEYADNGKPLRIDAIVVSTQHDDFVKPKNASMSSGFGVPCNWSIIAFRRSSSVSGGSSLAHETDDPALSEKAKDCARRLGLAYERRFTGYGDLAPWLAQSAQT